MVEVRSSLILRTIPFLIAVCFFALPAYAKYSGGTGEPNDPYQIGTAADLIALGETPEDYDKHFILTADIDLDPNLPGGKVFDRAVIAPVQSNPWDEEETSFTGVFDGKGHVISRLTITGQDDLGLFGQLRGQARNLGIVDANVAGSGGEIGGLAGYVWPDAEIVECHSAGTVRAGGQVGGLVGWNDGALTRCYSTSAVSGEWDVGGLVGENNGTAIQCYSRGVVSGTHNVGGLVGCEETGYLVQCYSTCVVNGAGWCIGGLVGTCQLNTVTQCYSTGAVRGQNYVGGLIGDASKVIIWDSYWDIESSGQTISAGGTGKTTAEMQTGGTFLMWVSCQNEIVWTIDEGNDYPRLWWERQHGEPIRVEPLSDFLTGTGTEEDPFLIYTPEELNRIGLSPCEWDRHFKLMSDIDLSGFDGKGGWPSFNPIGVCTQVWESIEGLFPHVYLVGMPFTGAFDGNGHTVSHLTLKSQGRCAGLFGGLRGGEVKNLGVVDVNIAALDGPVGGLVGHNSGTVTGCYSTGLVSGERNHVGGLVGYSDCSITHCYSGAAVSGNYAVGGLVGYNRYADYGGISIRSCYSTGTVTGTAGWGVGGLVGSAGYGWSGSLTASFWDTETSGQTTSEGGTGKTTAEMQVAKTFLEAGWDFVGETANGTEDIWKIAEGLDYPRLWWEPHDGRVTVVLGQVFTVTLESNPSTGYRWEWVDSQDSLVEQMGEAQFKPCETGDPPLVGAGGWESFDFKAVHQGQMTLKLVYRRPWEEGVEPLKTFSLQVTVP
jgi:predicted secreted protein